MSKWNDYLAFEKAVLRDSWERADWRADFKDWKKNLALFVIGSTILVLLTDIPNAVSNAVAIVASGLLAVITYHCIGLLWKVFSGPYRLWNERSNLIYKLEAGSILYEAEIQRLRILEKDNEKQRDLGRRMHAHIDAGDALIGKGHVSGDDCLKWLEKAWQLAFEWNEGEHRMLMTINRPLANWLGDQSIRLAISINKLRLIMGRVFKAADDEDKESKQAEKV
jgi:hypothetical protein